MHGSLSTNIYWTSGKPRTPPHAGKGRTFWKGSKYGFQTNNLIYLMFADSLSARGLHPRSGGAYYLASQRKTQKHVLKYIKQYNEK